MVNEKKQEFRFCYIKTDQIYTFVFYKKKNHF